MQQVQGELCRAGACCPLHAPPLRGVVTSLSVGVWSAVVSCRCPPAEDYAPWFIYCHRADTCTARTHGTHRSGQ